MRPIFRWGLAGQPIRGLKRMTRVSQGIYRRAIGPQPIGAFRVHNTQQVSVSVSVDGPVADLVRRRPVRAPSPDTLPLFEASDMRSCEGIDNHPAPTEWIPIGLYAGLLAFAG